MAIKSKLKDIARTVKTNNERGARKTLLEELFYDFNRSRSQVYVTNFVRGIMFGAGSVIGGTVVIALFIWLLSLIGNFVPPLGDFFDGISSTLEANTR
jgi:uncharacterized membrane protein YczE